MGTEYLPREYEGESYKRCLSHSCQGQRLHVAILLSVSCQLREPTAMPTRCTTILEDGKRLDRKSSYIRNGGGLRDALVYANNAEMPGTAPPANQQRSPAVAQGILCTPYFTSSFMVPTTTSKIPGLAPSFVYRQCSHSLHRHGVRSRLTSPSMRRGHFQQ